MIWFYSPRSKGVIYDFGEIMNVEDVSVGITGFIDILGFSEKVLNASQFADIDDITKNIEIVQTAFDFETEDSLTKEINESHKKTILAFSDCIVINIPLQSDATKYQGTFDPIMSELVGFAYAQGQCVQKNLFLRGGLDIGWWYQAKSTLVSQSMVRAYRSEGGANVPVIALTDELYEFFVNHKHREYYSPNFDPVHRFLRKYESECEGIKTEFWYLDYISICAESIGWQRSEQQIHEYRAALLDEKEKIINQSYRENCERWFQQHARCIETAHSSAVKASVKSKYEWLSRYHNEIAPKFTRVATCLCVV